MKKKYFKKSVFLLMIITYQPHTHFHTSRNQVRSSSTIILRKKKGHIERAALHWVISPPPVFPKKENTETKEEREERKEGNK